MFGRGFRVVVRVVCKGVVFRFVFFSRLFFASCFSFVSVLFRFD